MAVKNIKKSKHLPIKLLHKLFILTNGILYWRNDHSRAPAGSKAGYPNAAGYIDINYMGHRLYAHRVIFAMTRKYWPQGIIDHIDGDVQNNLPSNLRSVDDFQSACNMKTRADNRSGTRGVSAHSGGWHAEVCFRKVRHRKWFKQKTAAIAWAKQMRNELHGPYQRTIE